MDNLFGNWSHKNTHKNSKRGNIGMTEVEDYMWSVRVTIGTPAQTFFLVPDTGSGEILVPDSSCSTSSCGSTTSRYTKSASSTAVDQNRGAVNSYSFGLQNSGEVIKDTVTIAGSTVTSQQFVSCKTMSSALLAIPDVDGLGLGYAPLAASGATPFPFSNQAANGGNYFAMRLSDTYGYSELSMGNIDRARVGGQVHSFNVGLNANTGALKYWQIGLSSPNINGGAAVFGSRKTMIFDSGSNYIYAPPADAATFYAQVPGSAQLESGSNTYWTYPCANPPTVTFTFGRTIGFAWNKYAVNQNDFNLGLAAAGSSLCVGAVVGIDLNLGGWVLGTAFLKNWLVVYNMELNQISLAEPKDRQPTYIP
ncbi:acid protease [Meredithblackwellia eburnea MCA 4105]